ncbi:MAG: hypothetical protein LBE31_11625, partial [Deltaproteobacteria bacterium]|nr:hypothetical protein [Deltaproteobacteria bacterium]
MRKHLIFGLMTVLTAALLTGCVVGGGKRLNVDFRPQGGMSLQPGIVQLLVFDRRNDPNLVGAEATSKELLKESQSGQIDLTTTLPTGNTIALSHLSVQTLIYEAVKTKLYTLGVTGGPETTNAKARVTIYITEFKIDVEGSDYVGRVTLQAVIDRPG